MKKELLASGFWLLLSVYASIEALRLGLGAGNRPGPGFFPFGAAAAIGVIALSRLFKARPQQPSTNPTGDSTTGESKKILWVVGGLVSYGLLLESVGFLLCTFILMALFLKAVASRSWVTTLTFALSVAMAAHLFFNVALKAQLPKGILNF
jgi:hypothetical protein